MFVYTLVLVPPRPVSGASATSRVRNCSSSWPVGSAVGDRCSTPGMCRSSCDGRDSVIVLLQRSPCRWPPTTRPAGTRPLRARLLRSWLMASLHGCTALRAPSPARNFSWFLREKASSTSARCGGQPRTIVRVSALLFAGSNGGGLPMLPADDPDCKRPHPFRTSTGYRTHAHRAALPHRPARETCLAHAPSARAKMGGYQQLSKLGSSRKTTTAAAAGRAEETPSAADPPQVKVMNG